MFVAGISSERVAEFSKQAIPEERIMSKHFKNVAIKAFALACAGGLSLNGFALAVGATARTTGRSSRTSAVVLAAHPDPSPTPSKAAVSPARDNMSTQSNQGRQYGQAGFVGEPINLNVVNADIRDILNYITEQYGINFVIDNSVLAVPVTVNVQDVPWNYALDAIFAPTGWASMSAVTFYVWRPAKHSLKNLRRNALLKIHS